MELLALLLKIIGTIFIAVAGTVFMCGAIVWLFAKGAGLADKDEFD